jgi:hypothetical protein
MPKTINQRVTVQWEGDFVVFLIGMRINKIWKIHKWLPVATAMQRMLKELKVRGPEASGFLGAESYGTMLVQYWRSFDQLEAYAKDRDSQHLPAWRDFNKRVHHNGDVGIWHETYKVRAGEYECVFVNMPPTGLGKVGELVPATGHREDAAGRIAPKSASE